MLVVGGSDRTTNEGVDRANLGLPGQQLELVQRVYAAATKAGSKFALVLVHGRPLAEPWIKHNIPTVLETFLAGQAQGSATVDVLLGAYNPAGRLPIRYY